MKLFEKCIDCTTRYAGCHSDCPDYLKDRTTLDELKSSVTTEDEYFGYVGDSLRR